MKVPKYQWLIEDKAQNCGGFCDKLYISNTFEPKFQVQFEPKTIFDDNFDYDNIGAPIDMDGLLTDTYVFDASYTPGSGQDWVHTFTFLEEGIEHCYMIALTNDPVSLQGRVTDFGNFTLIEVDNGVLYKNWIKAAINAHFPDSVVADVVGTNIEVTGLPVGTQIVPGDNYPTVSGAGTANWGFNNFFPVNDKICFFNISKYAEIATPTTTPSIDKTAIINANNTAIFAINFTNDFGFDVDLDFIVMDDSYSVLDTFTKTAAQGTNTLNFSYQASGTPPPYYILRFQLSDQSVYADSIYDETTGFCFNSILAQEVEFIDKIEVTDCNGDTTDLGVEGWQWNHNGRYNYLISIVGYLPDIFQLTITGTDTDTFVSKWYEKVDPTSCDRGRLYKLEWSDDCMFADVDYGNDDTVFTNELLLTGVIIKQGLDKIDAQSTITSDGKKKSVYRHTIEQYEIRLHPYTAETQSTLERVFEHSIVKIDGDTYYVGDGGSYQVSELDNFIYTGRIDLYLSGSEVIKSSCCC